MAKESKSASKDVESAMRRRKSGTLKSGRSGKDCQKQALGILKAIDLTSVAENSALRLYELAQHRTIAAMNSQAQIWADHCRYSGCPARLKTPLSLDTFMNILAAAGICALAKAF
jgi:hypothetical protein